jgi:hypothetical protein
MPARHIDQCAICIRFRSLGNCGLPTTTKHEFLGPLIWCVKAMSFSIENTFQAFKYINPLVCDAGRVRPRWLLARLVQPVVKRPKRD